MAFCTNCGSELTAGAKFCQKCGTPAVSTSPDYVSARQQEYAGKVYKCPNCGEVLNSFTSNCPACGFELRDTKASSAIREFALKLEAIEAHREYEKPLSRLKQASATQQISKTDEQKISLIKNFAIPNTKEDILEFMILATSNIDMSVYGSTDTPTAGVKALTEAWDSKVKQTYAKAKNTFGSDPEFSKIQELYNSCYFEIKEQKKKKRVKFFLSLAWIPLAWIIIFVVANVSSSKSEAKEIERLENIIVEVQDALDKKEYSLALKIADSIDYQEYDKEMERKWDIQREYWIEKVLKEAATNGVELEYTPSPDVDKSSKDSATSSDDDNDDVSGGFFKGLTEGIKSGYESATKKSVEKSNEVMNDISTGNDESTSNMAEKTQASGTKDSEKDGVTSISSIEKAAVYTYGKDEYNLYVATAITDEIIKIENWSKTTSSAKSVSYDYDVGTYKINDAANGFCWLNDEQIAFSFNLTDEHDSLFKKTKTVLFTVSNSESDTNKGSYIQKGSVSYAYSYDDWNLYKATPINDDIIKIECWYRSTSVRSHHYSYDVCLIDIRDNSSNFEWTGEDKKAFTLTLTDSDKKKLKNGQFVVFEIEED